MTPTQQERRAHTRFDLTCPIVVADSDGKELLRTETLNVSDGGTLLMPGGEAVEANQPVHVNLRVPRITQNTFMYEDFFSAARVLRRQQVNGGHGLAVAFAQPLELGLEL